MNRPHQSESAPPAATANAGLRSAWRRLAQWGAFFTALAGMAWLVLASDPPLHISINPDGTVDLSWDAEPGARYQLYWNSNVTEDLGAWQLVTNLTASGPTLTFRDAGGPGRAHPSQVAERFYSLRFEQATNVAATVLNQDFLDSTTLRSAGSPYIITNDVRIRADVTLTVEPGVRFLFGPAGRLTVEGTFNALGSPQRPVVFTSSRLFAQPGDWPGLRWLGANASGSLSNAVVEFAVNGVAATDAAPTLSSITVRRSRDIGILLDRSSALVRDSLIERNGLDGIRAQNRSEPRFLGNRILRNGRIGIALVGASNTDQNPLALIRGNAIVGNVGLALDTSNFFQPTLQQLDCRSNWWGTAVVTDIPALLADQTDRATSPWVNWVNWLESETGPATPGRAAFGQVTTNDLWLTTESPVWVLGPLSISSNAAVQVQRGVSVRVVGNWRIDVSGSLAVAGTPAAPVTFTTARPIPATGSWLGVRFNDASPDATCIWSNAVVEFAVRGIECFDAAPTFHNLTLRESSQHGLYLERSSPLISGGAFENNTQDGIYCTWSSSPRITGARIRFNGSDGIELASSTTTNRNCLPVITGNHFAGNATYDLHANNYFQPAQTLIQARGNWWGTTQLPLIPGRIFDYHDRNTSPWIDWGSPLMSEGGTPNPGSSAVGPLSGNIVWRIADSPVTVVGNLIVTTNASLQIEPGVEVRFLPGFRIDVEGQIQTLGSEARPVAFTSDKLFPLPGDWEGIRFLPTSTATACILSNTIVEFARTGIYCLDAAPAIVGCRIWDNSQHGILLNRASPTIQSSALQYNTLDGIHCLSNSAPTISGCALQANGSDGIEVRGETNADRNSNPLITDCLLDGNVQLSLRTGNFFQPATTTIRAPRNWWGSSNPSDILAAIFDANDAASSPWVDWANWLTSPDGPATPGTAAYGTIADNRTWRAADSPVWILGPVTVATNASLQVEPGVAVQVTANWRIDVAGTLAVAGTEAQPVRFTTANPVPARGQWPGLRFTATSDDDRSYLSNAIVEFAVRGVECIDASPRFVGVQSRENSQHGIYLERSSPLIQGGLLEANTLDGLHCVWLSAPQVVRNRIRANGSDGIELLGITSSNRNSAPLILLNQIEGNTNLALNANTYFIASNSIIVARSNWWGTHDGTLIPPRIFEQPDNVNAPWVDWGNWLTSPEGPATPGRSVFGPIPAPLTWSPADNPISVIGPLTVQTGAVLRLDPGVQITFYVTNGLIVNGGLTALGHPTNPVVFTSGRAVPDAGSWGGIRFNPSSSNQPCVLSNAVVEYAMTGIYGQQTTLAVSGSHLRRNFLGLFLDNTSAQVISNLVEFNITGIHVADLSQATLTGNTITLQSLHGVNITPSRTTPNLNPTTLLSGNSFASNATAGGNGRNLFAGSFASPASVVILARSNWWAGATDTNVIDAGIQHRRDTAASPLVDFATPLVDNPNFAVTGTRPNLAWFSPNSDGSRDQIVVEASASHDADWEVLIQDDVLRPVARFPGNGRSISITWDGTGPGNTPSPEGRYRAVIIATGTASGAVTMARGDHFQLDRTAPASSPSIPVIADGTVIDQLRVLGSASDRSFAHYIVDFGAGVTPGSFTLVRSNNVAPSGIFTELDSRSLTNGLYTFRIRSVDLAGNVTETRIPIQIDNLSILDPQATTLFNPGAAPAEVSFGLTRTGDVLFQVCRVEASTALMGDIAAVIQTNRVLHQVARRLGQGRHSFTWDGTDLSGQPVTNGLYAFVIQATAELGRADSYNPEYVAGPVSVSNFSYSTNFAFYANQPCEVRYTLFAPAFVVLAVANRPYVVLWGDVRPAGSHVELWDGRSSADRSLLYGDFRLAIKPQVLPENALVVQRPAPALINALSAESYILTPTFSEVSEIHFELNRPAVVTLQLREPNGGIVTLLDRVQRASGTHRLEWNGTLANNILANVEGDYELTLQARESDSSPVATRAANIRVRR